MAAIFYYTISFFFAYLLFLDFTKKYAISKKLLKERKLNLYGWPMMLYAVYAVWFVAIT